jgi:adenosylcobinamide-GDP ribazoletransferase
VIRGLAAAVSFLTIVPVSGRWSPLDASRSAVFFPLVGWMVGGGIAMIDSGLAVLPMPVRASLVLGGWLLITGALHLDGLIDVFDALAPGLDRERARAALVDPRAGAVGVAAAIVLIAVKWSALASIDERRVAWLLLAPAIGRWAAVGAMVAFPYGRGGEGIGAPITRDLRPVQALAATALLAPAALLVAPWLIGALLAAAAAATVMIMAAVRRRVGFVSGDAYGAVIEICEALVLVVASVVASGGIT